MQKAIIGALERGTVMDVVAARLASLSRAINSREPLHTVMAGTPWLGHAAHPAFVDVPIGLWTTSWLLDLAWWNPSARKGADAFLAMGLVAAAPAIASGLSDLPRAHGRDRRVAAGHALVNAGATALYALSLVQRLRGRRVSGLALAWGAAGAATLGASIGGHLVFRRGVRVERVADPAERRARDVGTASVRLVAARGR